MPNITISLLEGRSPQRRRELLEAARRAVMEGFDYHGKGLSVRILEFSPENFLPPPGRSDRYMILEAVCFPGRTSAQLAAFYRLFAGELERLGEDSGECLMMVRDLPLENWGMAGGRPASEVFGGKEQT